MPSDYRLSPQLAARLMGISLVLLGLLVFALTLLIDVLGLPTQLVLLVFALGLLSVGGVGFWLTRRAYVVRLGETGYRVRFVRGAGVTAARWKDVEDAVTSTVADAPVIVLRLRDGRTTTIPVGVLAGDREQFVRDLHQHLQDGHGIRPVGG
ncbi:hypothetical protein [Nocardioides sp.]|uniref:hypothetical protein n=1 Tax=Nocardioides sp. TaxID=35761 RepID=UPI0027356C51|nr:hypothetical protein [Nocardioides sp.]MDP3893472.1 hypothetical protein [Nocardioides sp.]